MYTYVIRTIRASNTHCTRSGAESRRSETLVRVEFKFSIIEDVTSVVGASRERDSDL